MGAIYPHEFLTFLNNLLQIHLLQVYLTIAGSIFIYLQVPYLRNVRLRTKVFNLCPLSTEIKDFFYSLFFNLVTTLRW